MADLDDALDAYERAVEHEFEKGRKPRRVVDQAQQYLERLEIVREKILPPLREIFGKLEARGHGVSEETNLPYLVRIIMQPKESSFEYRLEFVMNRTDGRFTARASPAVDANLGSIGPLGDRATVALKDLSAGFVRDTTTAWIKEVLMADIGGTKE